MKTIKMKLKITEGTKFNINSINFDPQNVIKEPITWNSATPEIVTVDTLSGLVHAEMPGEGTLYATNAKGEMKVFCTIKVEEVTSVTLKTVAKASVASDVQPLSLTYASNCNNVSALGYTGKSFSYTQTGSKVTLECGWRSKNGIQDYYSSMFRSELVYMNNIYSAMTPDQRKAWLVLRSKGFIELVANILSSGLTETVTSKAREMLLSSGINLGSMLEATVMGLYRWYEAEQHAVSCFEVF